MAQAGLAMRANDKVRVDTPLAAGTQRKFVQILEQILLFECTLEDLIESGEVVVGTPDDAIAQIRRLQAKQGEFGAFLQLAHNWANWEATKKSYELWQRHVTPVINNVNANRIDSYEDVREHGAKYMGAAVNAAMATLQKHQAEEAAKQPKSAAE